MTILIVDDSPIDRKLLKKDLIKLGENEPELLEAQNKDEFLQTIKNNDPEIVFLDIDLGPDNAFKILDELAIRNFEVIFTTGHPQYAIDSYQYEAVHYLTKPTDINRLQKALQRAKHTVDEKNKAKKQELLLNNISDFPKFEQRIILAEQKQIHNKRLNEIIFIESEKSTCTFHFVDNTMIGVSKNLKYYEEKLENYHFYRVHNQFIVNLLYANAYIYSEDAVKLSNNKIIPVARQRKDGFFEALSKLSIK